jgi:16S rRNA G966 N2-methylase RsmD
MAHIPHMGGKQAIAKNLIDVMLFHNPEADTFVDVFGGGGSMSFEALSRPQIKRVIYNELNTGTVALLDKVMTDGVTPEFYEWISRERFHELKNGDCWRAGLVKNLWSFGNNQRTYCYGENIEYQKQLAHEAIVDKNQKSFDFFGLNIDGFFEVKTIQERRLIFCREIKKSQRFDLQHLESLQRLQHLESLQRLPIEGLITSNKSYEQLDLSRFQNAIIYCDPPYNKTEKYQEKFNSTAFFDWFRNHPQKIYLSEYDATFKLVYEKEKRVTMSAINNKLKKIEKLYVNHD